MCRSKYPKKKSVESSLCKSWSLGVVWWSHKVGIFTKEYTECNVSALHGRMIIYNGSSQIPCWGVSSLW